jgi:hypothetical protein
MAFCMQSSSTSSWSNHRKALKLAQMKRSRLEAAGCG